jgi:uncharacterized repeat protein (TIGR03803 family)
METLVLARLALITGVAAALLAACGGALPGSPGAPTAGAMVHHLGDSSSYQVLHSFAGAPDGANPDASLIGVNGVLYGTTTVGGAKCGDGGCGTVYSISASGEEHVLHNFSGAEDGARPVSGLIDVDGTLYGTTTSGGGGKCKIYGDNGCGSVYGITTTGKEHVLYGFAGSSNGSYPVASLIDVKNTFYGTTQYGGSADACTIGCGTVFSVTAGGQENVLHSFGYISDGAQPQAPLIDVNGTLYGTTHYGGSGNSGRGSVFSISTTGTEHVLYSFGPKPDGTTPVSGLTNVSGTLYGTTYYGGRYGKGTVFSVSTSGANPHVLHSFGKDSNGANLTASLIDVNGTLYGTTAGGGTYRKGTVFSISTTGSGHVLHNFGNGADGASPRASLTYVNGTLYGTTYSGGAHGDGTVFALKP